MLGLDLVLWEESDSGVRGNNCCESIEDREIESESDCISKSESQAQRSSGYKDRVISKECNTMLLMFSAMLMMLI
jgi:hypothetical protein